MSNPQKSSGLPYIVKFIIGAALMVGGVFISNATADLRHTLEEKGIPLDLGITVSVIGVFLILIPVLNTYYFKPLADAINERTTALETTFSEAEDLRAEMAKMKSDYEQRLAATEAEARSQIQAQIKEAQELRKTLMAEASAKADELVKRAQDEIESEKQKVLGQLRSEVVNLTLAASEKILGENMDSDKNRRLVAEFIDKVEVPS
jgi:F-type H+-transporting ATPase subunit b